MVVPRLLVALAALAAYTACAALRGMLGQTQVELHLHITRAAGKAAVRATARAAVRAVVRAVVRAATARAKARLEYCRVPFTRSSVRTERILH